MSTHFIIVRHCEAAGNTVRVFQGHIDSDVSPNGLKQGEYLAERFKNVEYDYIYSGPLKRTLFTAQSVNHYHDLPIQIEPDIIEINGGDWENTRWSELPKLYPEQAAYWENQPHLFKAPNGESMVQVRERMIDVFLRLAKKHKDKTVVVVSHGCAIRNLICWARGWDIDRLIDVPWCDNSGVAQIDIDENGKPTIIFENDNSHLPPEFSTLGRQSWWKKKGSPFVSYEE